MNSQSMSKGNKLLKCEVSEFSIPNDTTVSFAYTASRAQTSHAVR